MTKLYLLIGPPASGKSTVATVLARFGVHVACPDTFRTQYPDWAKNSASLFSHIYREMSDRLISGQDVVIDAMSLAPQHRRCIMAIGYATKSAVIGIQLLTPLDLCLSRHHAREKNISQSMLTDMEIERLWELQQRFPPTLDEGFHSLISVTPSDDPISLLNLIPPV